MSSYRDKAGVWAVFDYSEGARVSTIHSDVVPAVREADNYETVFFWPFDMDLDPAIEWWRKAEAEQSSLDDSIIHFFYITTYDNKIPFCEDTNRDDWVQFDHTARGKICPNCEAKLGREIK